ncbi:MAG TPA: Do family serine endopeptidase [Gammaproteobacteria bacterium]
MVRHRIRLFGIALLLAGVSVATAQDRRVEPLPSLAPLIEEVAPAVVNISIKGTVVQRNPFAGDPFFERFFGPQLGGEREFEAAGSGVIVDSSQGYLLTNHHVVDNADEITVTLADNREFIATVVGSDEGSDLAVLKIDGTDLTEIPFPREHDLRVGDYVVAIGNPLGLANTVTAGIVSALGRQGLSRDTSANVYEDFIQTDASINVGNSGGALVNLRGELVGINSAIISQTGGNIGIGLAIPASMVVAVMDQLIEFGQVRRGLLGVRMSTVSADEAEAYGLSVDSGALVMDVNPGSGAEAAGIEVNDIIVAVDGEPIESGNELRNIIGLMRPGTNVDVDVVRNGERMTLVAVLGEQTDVPIISERPEESDDEPIFEGVELAEGQPGGIAGLVVLSVAENSVAAAQGLREGDLITFVNRQRVRTLAETRTLVASARLVLVEIRRGNRNFLIRLR